MVNIREYKQKKVKDEAKEQEDLITVQIPYLVREWSYHVVKSSNII